MCQGGLGGRGGPLYIPLGWVGEPVPSHPGEHPILPGTLSPGHQHGLAARRRRVRGEVSLGSVWQNPMGERCFSSSGNDSCGGWYVFLRRVTPSLRMRMWIDRIDEGTLLLYYLGLEAGVQTPLYSEFHFASSLF